MGGGGVVNTVCAVSVMHSLLKLLKLVPAEFVTCGYILCIQLTHSALTNCCVYIYTVE